MTAAPYSWHTTEGITKETRTQHYFTNSEIFLKNGK